MKSWIRWLRVIALLTAMLVAGSTIALAVTQGSWGPIESVGWIPAVVVATLPRTYRSCVPGRRGQPG